jgi:hypothetical protein
MIAFIDVMKDRFVVELVCRNHATLRWIHASRILAAKKPTGVRRWTLSDQLD